MLANWLSATVRLEGVTLQKLRLKLLITPPSPLYLSMAYNVQIPSAGRLLKLLKGSKGLTVPEIEGAVAPHQNAIPASLRVATILSLSPQGSSNNLM